MAVDIGTSTAIVFGTTAFAAEVNSISLGGQSRPAIKTSHLGTTTADTFVPGDLVDQGTIEMEINFDPDNIPPIKQPAETITITWPLPSGQSTAATAAFSGFVIDTGAAIPNEDKMTQTITIKVSGDITYTDSA